MKIELKWTFLSALFWGFLAHGYMMTHKIAVHDELGSLLDYFLGATYTSGRWASDWLQRFLHFVFGGNVASIPWMKGFVSICILGVMACLIVQLYNIKNRLSCIAIGAIIVVFPPITTIFGYMFTSVFYSFAFFLTTFSVFLNCHYKKWYIGVASSFLFSFAIAIYQAVIPFAISLIWIHLIVSLVDIEKPVWKIFLKRIMSHLVYGVIALLVYLIILRISLSYLGLELTSYQGIDEFGSGSLINYIERISLSYSAFFTPNEELYPLSLSYIYYIIIAAVLLLSAFSIYSRYFIGKTYAIITLILICTFPIAYNFIYIMLDANKTYMYSLVQYAQVMLFLLFIVLLDTHIQQGTRIRIYLSNTCLCIVLLISFMYARYANVCYLKMDFVQSQMISYCTTLRTRIESIDGYNENFPVAFINDEKKSSINTFDLKDFGGVTLTPYSGSGMVNSYAWIAFMAYWCGYHPQILYDTSNIEDREEVLNMSTYPNAGSIIILDDVVVVHF